MCIGLAQCEHNAEPHRCQLLQVIDAETYRPFTVHKYPVPVLSIAASPTGDLLAAGMADGTLSVHRRRHQGSPAAEPTRLRYGLTPGAVGPTHAQAHLVLPSC